MNVFFAGSDPDDTAFAHTLAVRVERFAPARLVDVDALEDADDRGEPRALRFRGLGIFVLSPAMVRERYRRRKLLDASPGRNVPGVLCCYICRGIDREQLKSDDELSPLFDDVMVGKESQAEALVKEVEEYLATHPMRRPLGMALAHAARFGAASVLLYAAYVVQLAYVLGFFVAAGLVLQLLLGDFDPRSEQLAAWLTIFGAGVAINRVPALDVHPWLGSQWRGGRDALTAALEEWVGFVKLRRSVAALKLGWLAIPAAVVLLDSPDRVRWIGAVAFVLGACFPPVYRWAATYIRRTAYLNLGMSREEIERTNRFFAAAPTMFSRKPATLSAGKMRRWSRAPVRAFISYPWLSDVQVHPVALALDRALHGAHVPAFLDRRLLRGSFVSWRARVVTELLDCTHLFVLVDSTLERGRKVHDEVMTAVQRWETEVFPAVICVVEPSEADAIIRHPPSPLIKRLLESCPRLTPAEAADPVLVGHLVADRTYQGLLRDWLTLLRPRRSLRMFGRQISPVDVGLSRMRELLRFLLFVGAITWCVNGLRPSADVVQSGAGLFWGVKTERAAWRVESVRAEDVNAGAASDAVIAFDPGRSWIVFHHFPTAPQSSRFTRVDMIYRFMDSQTGGLSVSLLGDGKIAYPSGAGIPLDAGDDCRLEAGVPAGWSCRRFGLPLFRHPGGGIIGIRLAHAGDRPGIWRFRTIRLVRRDR